MSTEKFEQLPQPKKDTILNAAILCFGRSGYDKTAISEIAKEASISKAAVFHYFGTKEELFIYLVKYVRQEVGESTPKMTDDFFETLVLYVNSHFQLIRKHPGLFEFIVIVNQMVANKSFEPLTNLSEGYQEMTAATIYKNVNWEKFKPEYEQSKILNLTTWVATGFLTQMGNDIDDSEVMGEIQAYLDVIKQSMYKSEYL